MDNERIRLYITPFNPDLIDRYIPPSLKAQAINISFHTVETFPERGFGYVELPKMEAQKLKKKLNGSVLKGTKVKIEEARPEKKRKTSEAVDEGDSEKKARKKAKKEKRKHEDGLLPGHELEKGRSVKRGWTEDAPSKNSRKKDKADLKDKKMKFKTEVPLNKLPVSKESKKYQTKEKEEKAKKPKSGKKAVVVKEFSKSKKPNTTGALSGRKDGLTYEEGSGWVDADGIVVEAEPPAKKRIRAKAAVEAAQHMRKIEVVDEALAVEALAESETEESSEEESSSEESDIESSSEDEQLSASEDAEDDLDRQLNEAKTNTASNAAAERARQHSIPVPSGEQDSIVKEVHPLEALFKRPPSKSEEVVKPKPAPIDTSFSFFNSGADDEDGPMIENNIPQTPHTKEDLEWRSTRSAAPTPDTAAIGKRFDFDFTDRQDEEAEDEQGDIRIQDAGSPRARTGTEKGGKEESDFRKWFYENRGDLNRSWKKRRREERKIVRQRENRRLSRRVA